MSRILDNEIMGDDELVERTSALSIYVNILGRIRLRISCKSLSACQMRDAKALDHVLYLGLQVWKTTMAFVIANELGSISSKQSGPVIEKQVTW